MYWWPEHTCNQICLKEGFSVLKWGFFPFKQRRDVINLPDKEISNANELEFAIFCIENVAAELKADPRKVYEAFAEESNILYGYIIPEFEMLHTQSKEYIVRELLEVMEEKGVTL